MVRERWLVDGIIGGFVVLELGLSACRSVGGRSAQRALVVAALQERRDDDVGRCAEAHGKYGLLGQVT